MGNNEYVFCKPNVARKVADYLREAPKVYRKEYKTGIEDDIDDIILGAMRSRIKNDASRTNPIDLADIYDNLMTENMARLREVESLIGQDSSTSDLLEWNFRARAFLDLIGIIRTYRYDMQGATFMEDGKYVVESPIDMIEEQADYYAHNSMVKRTSKQQHDLISTMFIMRSNIEGAIANMTSEQLDNFRGIMNMKRIAYEDALNQHNANSEYINNIYTLVPSLPTTIDEQFRQCVWYQKEYNVDMVRKYGDRKDGLIAYVDGLEANINSAIMGGYDF